MQTHVNELEVVFEPDPKPPTREPDPADLVEDIPSDEIDDDEDDEDLDDEDAA